LLQHAAFLDRLPVSRASVQQPEPFEVTAANDLTTQIRVKLGNRPSRYFTAKLTENW
jgi:hypothetical protein